MKQLSDIVYKALTNANFPNIGKKVYPVVAVAGAQFPFITYAISIDNSESKDRARRYSLDIHVYDETYSQTVSVVDSIINDIMPQVSQFQKTYRFSLLSANIRYAPKDKVFIGAVKLKIIK